MRISFLEKSRPNTWRVIVRGVNAHAEFHSRRRACAQAGEKPAHLRNGEPHRDRNRLEIGCHAGAAEVTGEAVLSIFVLFFFLLPLR